MVVVMEDDDLITHVRSLRVRGATPKAIAKTLGITRAEADALVRRVARESATEAALVGCWVNAGWSQGLSWSGHPDWCDDDDDGDALPGLVSVLVIREHRYERLTACAYLVDAHCLGVKNALGPRVLDRTELDAFVARQYAAYDRPPLRAPLELARELVFGAEEYAPGLRAVSRPSRYVARAEPDRVRLPRQAVVHAGAERRPARGARCARAVGWCRGLRPGRGRAARCEAGEDRPAAAGADAIARAQARSVRGSTGLV
jgi:hypothetical protein